MIAHPDRQLPQMISLACRADEAVWADALVLVTLKMLRKNDIHLVVGPSDGSGTILVTRSQMEAQAEREVNQFSMDYLGPAAFSGEILVTPMDTARLNRAVKAYAVYHSLFADPEKYLNDLQTALGRLQHLAPASLSVQAVTQGADDVKIRTENTPV